MVKITLLGIPKRVGKLVAGIFSGWWGLALWRLFLVVVGLGILVGAASSAGFLAAFFITSVIAWFYQDDITATLRNIWHFEFYEVEL